MKKAVSITDIFSTSLFVLAAIAAIWAPVAKASSILSVSSEAKDTDRKWDLLDSSIPLAQYLAKVTGIPIRAESPMI